MPGKVTVSEVIDSFLRAGDAAEARDAIGVGTGASYVDGEVATYNDLPTSVVVAPVDSAYLVRQSSGVWLINYRPAGIWVRTGSGGTLADWTYAGVFPDVFRSNNFRVIDSGDATKALAFDLSAISSGQTRTLTVPNASGTISLVGHLHGISDVSALADALAEKADFPHTHAPTEVGLSPLSLSNGTLNIAGPSLTGSQAFGALAIAQTWNTTGTPTAIDLNVTDTASNAASLFLNFRRGGTSQFSIRRDGLVTAALGMTISGTTLGFRTDGASMGWNGLQIAVARNLAWGPIGSASDLEVWRDAADILAQRRGTNAQAFRLYGTFTDASNHRRLAITSTTGGLFTLTAEGAGTGASGNILALSAPVLVPAASVSLGTNGHLAFEATSNTSLTIRYRGSDGTTRSVALTLS